MRRDTIRNRRNLLRAVPEIMLDDPSQMTMPRAAELAEVSVATAYRYFTSVDELVMEYVMTVLETFAEAAEELPDSDTPLRDVLRLWVAETERHGHVLIAIRSHEGFLERLEREERGTVLVRRAWAPALRRITRTDPSLDALSIDDGVYFCNALCDPRDIRDLRQQRTLSTEQIAERLHAALVGALAGWSASNADGQRVSTL